MKKIVKKIDAIITVLITVYIIGNIETILFYSYKSPIDTPNSIWLKFKALLKSIFGRSAGISIFYKFNSLSWWFVEKNKNIIFLVFIMLLIILSLIIRIKQKECNKIIVGYYVICCFLMIFISFFASPKFADYYFWISFFIHIMLDQDTVYKNRSDTWGRTQLWMKRKRAHWVQWA